MKFRLLAIILTLLSLVIQPAYAAALLELADVEGERDNQLVGYGLVVGLSGTGDRSQVRFASQSLNNMLKQFGVQLDEDRLPRSRNVAAVAVTATLPSTASPGQQLDVTIMSLGDAKSLHGGSLMMTPLRGVDGKVYALAQGNIVVGGVNATGSDGSSITVNVPTAGIIPGGAIIERAVVDPYEQPSEVVLNLKDPNYQTARNMVLAINEAFGPEAARAINQAKIAVAAPRDNDQRLIFMSILQGIDVDTGSQQPRVIFNSRTGTVVMNELVRVRKAAVSHGNLTITIAEQQKVSQPIAPFSRNSQATTERYQSSQVAVDQENAHMMLWPEGTSLNEIVAAINALGATPAELMSILIALDNAGALEAELVVI